MDGIQTLLVIVIISLTVLLIVVGFQVLMIIVELRRALKKLNAILDDSILGGGLLKPKKFFEILKMLGRKNKFHQSDSTEKIK